MFGWTSRPAAEAWRNARRVNGRSDEEADTRFVYYGTVLRASNAFAVVLLLFASRAFPAAAQSVVAPQLRIDLSASQEHYRDRVTRAATEALAQLSLWLGPFPHPTLTIHGMTTEREDDGASDTIDVRLPWLSAPSTMEVEQAVSYAIAMRYWPHDDRGAPVARGLASFLQGRITERLFNIAYARPGHHTEHVRLFGGHVPFAIQTLRLSRWNPRENGPEATAFAALERYLGWPVLQGALKALATTTRGAPLTRDGAVMVLGAAAGQDLAWFFDVAFDSDLHIDYAVTELTSEPVPEPCPAAGCVRTRVGVQRRGNARFKAVPVQVLFSDGQQATGTWDGRALEHTFEFHSPSPARSARLDPDGVLLLDPTRLDHVRFASPETNLPIAKWMSRWLVWLQDALITYSAFL